MKALRTPVRAIRANAASGSNLSNLRATTGTPKYSAGSMTLSRPPAQAQSAGVHSRSPGCGRNSCGIFDAGQMPEQQRDGRAGRPSSAGPVVPDV